MLESIVLLIVGVVFVVVGVFIFRGNIQLIHSYHWKRVTNETKSTFCKIHGFAVIVLGLSFIVTAVLKLFKVLKVAWIFTLVGLVVCLILIVFAQVKYNKGFF